MGTTTFVELVSWVIAHGYFLFFIAAFFEGPLVTSAAGVAAGLGYYNVYLIFLISILGDLTADVIYYSIGYLSRKTLITKYGHYLGLTKERIEKTENLLHRHAGKAMVIIKLSPLIPVPGLILIGSARVPIRKFITISLLITVPKSLLFCLLGFYSAKAYEHLSSSIASSQYIFLGIVIVVIAAYYGYQKISLKISKKIQD